MWKARSLAESPANQNFFPCTRTPTGYRYFASASSLFRSHAEKHCHSKSQSNVGVTRNSCANFLNDVSLLSLSPPCLASVFRFAPSKNRFRVTRSVCAIAFPNVLLRFCARQSTRFPSHTGQELTFADAAFTSSHRTLRAVSTLTRTSYSAANSMHHSTHVR